jgi:GH15 family glucan-1,4-alpha-glucosidase
MPEHKEKPLRHTFNMGIVGNCSFLGYIDTRANVKWLCLPRFDSSFLFGSLLDEEQGGEFSVTPGESQYQSSQQYLKNTNILVTEFHCRDGHFTVTDFAPRFTQYDRYFKPLMLIRKIRPVSGNPLIRVRCRPVGEYGRIAPQTAIGSNHIRFLNLDAQVRLSTDIPLNYILDEQPFILSETYYLILTYGVPLEAPIRPTAEAFLDQTRKYWQDWVKGMSIPYIFQEQVIRSALVLKLHQFEDTGGIIAAGTTSLPEEDGSVRNWDYRYCWIRDTYYTLNAFSRIGHFEEVEKYFNFIHNIIVREKDRIRPLYTVTGGEVGRVRTLPLRGYLGNQPVRIGNDATLQVQNDVYGQILVSLLPLFADHRLNYYNPEETLSILGWLVNRMEETLLEPDSGLWEFGDRNQLHCYTMLFHWAGSCAALNIARFLGEDAQVNRARRLARQAKAMIERCFDPARGVYTQAVGSDHLDASGLQLITMNYLEPSSRKARLHLQALEKELKTPDGLLYRYVRDEYGTPATSFLVCSFWYAEALAATGKLEEAVRLITKLLSYSNHLGLYSEDADPAGGQWGNFPQTYSHVGLINAVYRISTRTDKPMFL